MGIYDKDGEKLRRAFALSGQAVRRAYALDGNLLWSAHEVEDFAYAGAQTPWDGWKFKLLSQAANMNYASVAEAAEGFDDSGWERVTIPHDWSIYLDFNADSASTYEGGFLDGGDAWYRCRINATEGMLSDQTVLSFGAVYMECVVYLNGRKVGEHHYGFAPFEVDVSEVLREGENTLALFVRNRQPGCRWYSGSGIFRPVYLLVKEGAGKWVSDPYITSPSLEEQHEGDVTTHIAYTVHNTGEACTAQAKLAIYKKGGACVATATQALTLPEGETVFETDMTVSAPDLWDVGAPNLYELEIKLSGDFGSYIAPRETFGYRWTTWSVDNGFNINGRNQKLYGVYMHQDLGCIGSEINRSAMERQIDSMVQMGVNMMRIAHCPSSEEYLELCTEKGVMLVEDFFDCWSKPKHPYDFGRFFEAEYESVIDTVVKKHRNNPAIIMWSIGDEVSEVSGSNDGNDYGIEAVVALGQKIVSAVKARDATRPVTMGENKPNTDQGRARMALMDVVGINYNNQDLSYPHEIGKPVYSSGTSTAVSSRGVYARDNTNYQCSSLDDDTPSWGGYAGTDLRKNLENPYSGGVCVWTGWDYIGEPTPFNVFPTKSSYFGLCDLAGFPKDIYYMYQSRFTTKPMVHIFPRNMDDFEDGTKPLICVYSNCYKVELYVNGKLDAAQTQDAMNDKYMLRWWPPFHPGTITVKGYNEAGELVATDEVKTSTGVAAKLSLSSYKPTVNVNSDDLVFITCDILDANGVFVPDADTVVTFTCEGGTVLGTDNGNAACVENMRGNVRSAFSGKCLCVCRHDGTPGDLVVTASADGVEGASVTVTKEAETALCDVAEDGQISVWRFKEGGSPARIVNVPHDWSIEKDFDSASAAEYEGGYLDGGEAVYETTFLVPDKLKSKRTMLCFDGAYMESAVTLNGEKLGENKNGYNPFEFDVTDKLADGVNTLRVDVANRQPNSRWYSGSGLYRPVWLEAREKQGFAVSELVITAPDLETQAGGDVTTQATFKLHNFGETKNCQVVFALRKSGADSDLTYVSSTEAVSAGENEMEMRLIISAPKLWDIGAPNLYEAVIRVNGAAIASCPIGYRYAKWEVDTGFWLNGRRIKLQGVCLHHDLGCIGAEANRSAMERQLDRMLQMGANAIRLTHNPGSKMMLELCRDKGILCVEEFFDCWTRAKKTNDFARFFDDHAETVIETTVRRSINNPAVIMWSLGNEIAGGNSELGYTQDEAANICTRLIAAVKAIDETRPVTMGINNPDTDKFAAGVMPLLDVVGVNYNKNVMRTPHELGKPAYGSETTSALSSRGEYARDETRLQCSSFDDDKVAWGDYAGVALYKHMTNAYSGGMFVWTGWDYIGEPTPFNKFPAKSSYFGICDLAGFPKDVYYLYQSRWTSGPMIHIMPGDWDSWTEGETVKVYLYTNCDTMELFQNGVSLGTKTKSQLDFQYRYAFDVPYAKGELTAKGYDASGNVAATDTVKSSDGTPAKLELTAEKGSVGAGELAFIRCRVLDKDGVMVAKADNRVIFSVVGGTVLGTDNGNAACVENMRRNARSAFNGMCLCVVRPDGNAGEMVVSAWSEGMTGAKVSVTKE